MASERTRELARIKSADIADVYNGMLGLRVDFEYEVGGGQLLTGYMLDAAMVARFMGAVGIGRLSDAALKSCWVTHDHCNIYKVEPLHAKDGKPFDIEEWQAWIKERMPPISWSELETGKRPPNRSGGA
jgi:hypothetical protein